MSCPVGALAAAGDWGSGNSLLVVLILGALSLLPFLVLLMSSFVKISVVLAILRSALGTTQILPSQIVTGVALVLTVFVMAPTGSRMLKTVEPFLNLSGNSRTLTLPQPQLVLEVGDRAKEPLREFLLKQTDPKERASFFELESRLRAVEEQGDLSDRDFVVLVPAFLSSELRRAFEIGFLVYLPFLVIDLVVSNVLLALGMQMLSPTTVSLPLKLLLFVLADGWQLLLRGLVESYG